MASNWTVNTILVYPQLEGQQNVVFLVNWSATLESDGFLARVNGEQIVTGTGSFTPYENLTEAQVIQWVRATMGDDQVANTETSLVEQIEAQKSPPIAPILMPLPWGK